MGYPFICKGGKFYMNEHNEKKCTLYMRVKEGYKDVHLDVPEELAYEFWELCKRVYEYNEE